MDVSFRRYDPARDEAALIEFLTTERWPHRVEVVLTEADVRRALDNGRYARDDVLTFLVERDGELVGYVRADGLGQDGQDPQLDFRLRERVRGQGIGRLALTHITRAIFDAHPRTRRIEAQTRSDNIAMRRCFVRGGYVQEAVYRRAWPDADGRLLDGIGYAILREDWESGTTTPVVFDEP